MPCPDGSVKQKEYFVEQVFLSSHHARVTRYAAFLFMLIACLSAAGTIADMMQPGLSVRCGLAGCADLTSLFDLAPEDARPALAASPSAQESFTRYVRMPIVRAGLAAVQLVNDLPFAALMIAVGFALRLAAHAGDHLANALPWLRRASIAALMMAVATPVASSLRAMILLSGTPSGPMWYFEIDIVQFVFDIMLALAAFAVAWALDAGSRAKRDLAEFV